MKRLLWGALIGVGLLVHPQSGRAEEGWLSKTNAFLYHNVTKPTQSAYQRSERTIASVCDQALSTAVQYARERRLQIDVWEWYPNPAIPIYFYGGVGFGYPQPIKFRK